MEIVKNKLMRLKKGVAVMLIMAFAVFGAAGITCSYAAADASTSTPALVHHACHSSHHSGCSHKHHYKDKNHNKKCDKCGKKKSAHHR